MAITVALAVETNPLGWKQRARSGAEKETTWRSSEIPTEAWWYLFLRADITIATTQSKPRPVTALQRPLNRRLAYCIPVKVATARPSRNGIFNRILIAPPPSRLRVDERKR
jgi:hypothetical protein